MKPVSTRDQTSQRQTVVSSGSPVIAPTRNSLQLRRTLVGEVVSQKMQKTVVVQVARRFPHRFYKKYISQVTRYLVHDEHQQARLGDRVQIVETRPLSRRKRWALQKIIRSAGQESTQLTE